MIQFNIHRFGKLARWTLVRDRKYNLKSFLQNLVVLTLVFVFLTTIDFTVNQQPANYLPCGIAAIVTFAVTLIVGSSFMFYSMDHKHDMQTLLMLPASNLEKYLMCYASWIILLPLQLVAFFAADLIQYVYNMLLGHEWTMFVTQYIADIDWGDVLGTKANGYTGRVVFADLMVALWLHSLYALGATFFRPRKHNWIMTSVVLILGFFLLVGVFGWGTVNCTWWNNHSLFNELFLLFAVFNFWLSYRLFCRRQLIGRFINI